VHLAITIYDFAGKHKTNNILELEDVLNAGYSLRRNGFWISHDEEQNPTLAILVADDLAVVHYFPFTGHPGFVSVGKIEVLDKDGFTTFSYDTIEQEQEVINSQVIPFSSALLAAKDFFAASDLPKSIEWLEL
jgi:hypothetical protein